MGSHSETPESPDVTEPLPTPVTPAGRDGLDAVLTRPDRAVIALDFDGTLAPIVADPEQARAHPDAVPALAALAPKVASVAVITGRPAGVAVRHGGFAGVPGLDHLVVLGHYGAERWDARTGTVNAPAPHPGVAAVRAELPGVLDRVGAWHGTWIEEKGRAVAVHTRRAQDPQAAFEALREPLADLATRHGLIVEPGRMVLELRPRAWTRASPSWSTPARSTPKPSCTPATTWATSPPSPPSTNSARTASRASWCAAAARKSPNWPNARISSSTARRDSYAC